MFSNKIIISSMNVIKNQFNVEFVISYNVLIKYLNINLPVKIELINVNIAKHLF